MPRQSTIGVANLNNLETRLAAGEISQEDYDKMIKLREEAQHGSELGQLINPAPQQQPPTPKNPPESPHSKILDAVKVIQMMFEHPPQQQQDQNSGTIQRG